MAKYQKYAEYKDSGIEWLGQVPKQWIVTKLKYVKSEEQNAFVDGPFGSNLKSEHFIDNGDVYVIESNFATTGRINIDDLKTISLRHFETISRSEAKSGDIILAKIGARYGSSAILPTLPKKSVVSGNSLKLTIKEKICDVKFALYLLGHLKNEGAMDDGVNGSAQPALSLGGLNCLPFLLPTFTEQKSIANFLDYETAKIDSLIAKQEKLIELLKEKRQAVISHAVTKGLNPDVTMKDSGVEWLGQVPEHWEILKFDYAINTVSDIDHYMPSSVDVGIPYIMTGDLKDFVSDIDFESCKQVAYSDYQKLSRKIKTTKDDIIFARYATIGTLSYVDIDKEFLVSYSCVTIKSNSNRTTGKYLSYYLKSQAFLQAIQQQINSNTQGNVGVDSLRNVKIILPLLSEQENIIEFLQAELIKMDNLINKAESAIQLMQERRTALISSAVTGKIDVRNWQHPNEAKTGLSQ